jgi:hypothetical protein
MRKGELHFHCCGTGSASARKVALERGRDPPDSLGTLGALSSNIMNDFDDEDTQPFTRFVAADDELGLEGADAWFWSDADAAEAQMLDAMP